MKQYRTLIIFALALGLLAIVAPGALADNGPHDGTFAINTDTCAACHRAHTAQSAKLIRSATQYTICTTCHDGTGANTKVTGGVYLGTTEGTQNAGLRGGGFDQALMNTALDSGFNETGAATTVTSKHTAGAISPTVWASGGFNASSDPGETISALDCGSCHNPHGNGQYRILRRKPNGLNADAPASDVVIPDEVTKNYTTSYDSDYYRDMDPYPSSMASQMAEWCGQCHQRDEASPGSSSTHSTDTIFSFRHLTEGMPGECLKCHVAHGTSATMSDVAASSKITWPGGAAAPWQGSESDYSRLLQVDNRGICVRCHVTPAGDISGHLDGADCTQCHDPTSGGHPSHLSANYKAWFTPKVCTDCHGGDAYYAFSDGNTLEDTNACDTCHSPQSTYDGTVSTGGSVGSKTNWGDKVYDGSHALQSGKERWCAGCHDTAVGGKIDIVGSGFYTTGHGAPTNAPEEECQACHDTTSADYPLKAAFVLSYHWSDENPAEEAALCFLCHDFEIYHDGESGSNFPEHEEHTEDRDVSCYACHAVGHTKDDPGVTVLPNAMIKIGGAIPSYSGNFDGGGSCLTYEFPSGRCHRGDNNGY